MSSNIKESYLLKWRFGSFALPFLIVFFYGLSKSNELNNTIAKSELISDIWSDLLVENDVFNDANF